MQRNTYAPLRQVLRLAFRDFVHDSKVSICFVLALTAVLTPLLVLFGLKFGLIDTLARRLVESPHTREIVGVGSGRYEEPWFRDMAARPDVAFIIPGTRRIAASFSSIRNPANGRSLRAVQMVPTATGDPLLSGLDVFPLRDDQAILSAAAARRLGVGAGDSIEARVDRRYQDRDERALVVLDVVAVAAEALFPPEGVFLPLRLLVATEDYRDGIAVPELNWRGRAPGHAPRQYAKFRLYANSIYDVASLKEALTEQGVETRTQAADIETMRVLDKNLSRVFWLIALIGITGFLASLAANLLANVERERRELSVVCLLGFPTRSVVMFPMVQAALVGVLGAITAFLIYAPVAGMLNIWFTSSLRPGESICRLLPVHFLTALLVTLVVAITAAAWAGYRVAQIEPAEGIRDV